MPSTRSASKGYNLRRRGPKSDDSNDEDYGKPARKKAKTTRKKTTTTKAAASPAVELKIGEPAPIFEDISDEDGNMHSLKDFKGKKLVLFFYPKDNTPGCTTECLSFRDQYDIFKKNDIEVVGVSSDTVKSHQGVKTNKNLPYHLLSDPDLTVIKSFGLKGRGNGSKRTTVVIDENGNILRVYNKVSVKTHVAQILKDLGIKEEQEEEEEEGEEEGEGEKNDDQEEKEGQKDKQEDEKTRVIIPPAIEMSEDKTAPDSSTSPSSTVDDKSEESAK